MKNWPQQLKTLETVLKPHGRVLSHVHDGFETDYAQVSRQTHLFATDAEGTTDQNVDYLREWHITGHAPSLTAICARACEVFEIKTPDLLPAIMTASVLGEVVQDHPYHNNMHFRKVLIQVIRTVAVHNAIFAGTQRALNERQIAMLMIAACIHDLGHDGKGNTMKGVLIPFRLEQASFDQAKPYLLAAGYADEKELNQLEVLLRATDVSPLDDPASPMRQMKAAYRYHFMGENARHHKLNLSPELACLEKDATTTQMALLLHEADISTSAGLSYGVSQYETAIYRQEIGFTDARPSHVLAFLNQICQRQFLGDAARKLYSANLARIYTLADQDQRSGDEPYPSPDQTDFIVFGSKGEGNSKTLN